MLELKEITYDNLKAVIKLSETLSEQDKKHVATNVVSLAEAYLNYDIAWPRAIVVDDVVVGFVMLGLDNYIAEEKDWPVYFLWRFMMGTEYQGKDTASKHSTTSFRNAKKRAESISMSPVHALTQCPIKCISTMDLKILALWMMERVC